MNLSDFDYRLPDELIARRPSPRRSGARLLCLDAASGALADANITDLPERLQPRDLLVFNDSRVIPARLFGRKTSGGRVELLLERLLDDRQVLAQLRASRAPRAGAELEFEGGARAVVGGRRGELFELRFDPDGPSAAALFERHGHTPLPPYIARPADAEDRERYQTIYARHAGSVAAPTAGLHFDRALFQALRRRGVGWGFVTLHVGAGTFQPVRARRIEEHRMHAERISVDAELCRRVARARAAGGRVVAVGTTAVRSLETAARGGSLSPYQGDTDIYIYPGYEFRCVDALITNFHLPGSTLLMLVAAFAGYRQTMSAYRHAVAARYRFYSYGDAMLITRPAADVTRADVT